MTDTENPVGLLSLEDTMSQLERLGFTREEASRCIVASSQEERQKITLAVQARVKKEQKK